MDVRVAARAAGRLIVLGQPVQMVPLVPVLPRIRELDRAPDESHRRLQRGAQGLDPERVVAAARIQALDLELGDALLPAVAEGLAHDDRPGLLRHAAVPAFRLQPTRFEAPVRLDRIWRSR
jgi:hypothetical protein